MVAGTAESSQLDLQAGDRERELTVKGASVRKSPKPAMPQRHSSNMATHSSPFQTILQIGYQVFKHRSLGRSFSFTLPHTPASQIQAVGAHFPQGDACHHICKCLSWIRVHSRQNTYYLGSSDLLWRRKDRLQRRCSNLQACTSSNTRGK